MYENEITEEYWEQIAREMGEELGVDTREGSVYMDTQAGHILRVSKFYNDLNSVFNMFAVDTCVGDILTENAARDGIYREMATSSYWTAIFEGAKPEPGAVFMCEGYYFTWTNIDNEYYLVANISGSETNKLRSGSTLIPMENIDSLVSATLGTLVIPGINQESDDKLRERWRTVKSGPAGNGNKQHYKTWCESIAGIGRARILPLWGGENTVKAVLFSSDGFNVSSELVAKVQDYIDPIESGYVVMVDGTEYVFGDGVGEGIANLGAHFLAVSAETVYLTITASVTIKDGYTMENAKNHAREQIIAYLKKLALETSDNSNEVVRISSIGSIISDLDEVLDYDYHTLKINGAGENITVDLNSVAVLSEVVFNAQS